MKTTKVTITNREVIGLSDTIEDFRVNNPNLSFRTILKLNRNIQTLTGLRDPIEQTRKEMYAKHGEAGKDGLIAIKESMKDKINKQWEGLMDETVDVKFAKLTASTLANENNGAGPRSCKNIWDILNYMVDIDIDEDFMQDEAKKSFKKLAQA